MEQTESNKKISKLAVFVFILAILNILGVLSFGFSYDAPISIIVSLIIGSLIIWLAFYTKKRTTEKNLLGAGIAKFSFYTFIVIVSLDLIASLVLISYANKLKTFATTKTQSFFSENLVGLKDNSTPELNKVLNYEYTSQDIYQKFSEVGAVKECLQESKDINQVMYGISLDFNKPKLKLTGDYSVRCYGDKKPFDFEALVEYNSGRWVVSDYIFNLDIEKDFNYQESNISK